MIVGEKLLLQSIAIGLFLIFSSQDSDAYPRCGRRRGIRFCSRDDECDKTELCSIDTIFSKTVTRCQRSCEYPHRDDMFCVNPVLNYPIQCHNDSDCGDEEVCHKQKHKCIDACDLLPCGQNSFCKVVYERQTACRCLNGYSGNPYKKGGCERERTFKN